MASRKENIKSLFKNTRSRTIIIIVAITLIIALVAGIISFRQQTGPISGGGRLQGNVGGISSTPGALNQSPEYAKLQNEQNLQNANQALTQGKSAIPTIIDLKSLGEGVSTIGPQGGKGSVGFQTLANLQNVAPKPLWLQDLLNSQCDQKSYNTAIQNNASISDLQSACSCSKLKSYGYELAKLVNICSCQDLKEAGTSAIELKKLGYDAGQLKICGFSSCDLKSAGFSATDLKNAGFSDSDLAGMGFSPSEIGLSSGLPAGVTALDVKNAGCSVEGLRKLKAQGVSAAAIRRISGCDAAALKNAGYSLSELKNAGFSPGELKAAGFSDEDLKQVGISPGQEQTKQITADDVRKQGCSAAAIKKELSQGVSAAAIVRYAGCNQADLKAAGLTDDEIKQAMAQGLGSCEIQPIINTACDPAKLAKLGVSVAKITAINHCPATVLKSAGFKLSDILASGFSAKDLAAAGFSNQDIGIAFEQNAETKNLSDADITKAQCQPLLLGNLRRQGITAARIKASNQCQIADFKAACFSPGALISAGFTPDELQKTGFLQPQIQQAQNILQNSPNISDQLIKESGCDVNKLTNLRNLGVLLAKIQSSNHCEAKAVEDAGYCLSDLLSAGFSPQDLRALAISDADIQQAQNNLAELLSDKCPPETELSLPKASTMDSGCDLKKIEELRKSGTKAETLRNNRGCSAAVLNQAGFVPAELKAAGYTVGELAKSGFSLDDLLKAGYSPSDLKDSGFSAKDLLAQGVKPDALRKIGFTADDLKKAGLSANQLTAAGFPSKTLKDAGFSDAAMTNLPSEIIQPASAKVAELQQQLLSNIAKAPTSNVQKTAEQGFQNLNKAMDEQRKIQTAMKFQQKIQQKTSLLLSYASQVMNGWKQTGNQVYVAAAQKIDKQGMIGANGVQVTNINNPVMGGPASLPEEEPDVFIKSGDILFAVIDTAVNTDEPSPILATIANGPLRGAKLIGSFNLPGNADKTIITFTTLSIQGLNKTTGISAYAIDPNTGRTALSSSTNHHYLMRYGALFASTFIQGFGNAFQSADTTITIGGTGGTGGPNTTTVQNGIGRSLTSNAVIGLATLGQSWGQQAQQNMAVPTTVQVYSGTPIGVLFLQDVSIQTTQTK